MLWSNKPSYKQKIKLKTLLTYNRFADRTEHHIGITFDFGTTREQIYKSEQKKYLLHLMIKLTHFVYRCILRYLSLSSLKGYNSMKYKT